MTMITIIGAGNMGKSLVGGLIAHGGYDAKNIFVCDPNQDNLVWLQKKYAIQVSDDNEKAIANADVIMFAIKPQIFAEVASSLRDTVTNKNILFMSIAAGVREKIIQTWLGGNKAIVRAMPNTPALLACGATGLYANQYVNDTQKNLADNIMRALGITCWVDNETQLDIVTALSGSGPAYFFLFMEALENAAVKLGLPKNIAHDLTLQTALGAARMAIETDMPLAILREQVTSKGGTTEQGIAVFEQRKLRVIADEVVAAATKRAQELG